MVREFGSDLSGVVVALPGARPGRILEELMAREVGADLRPPKVVTAGVLSDELLVVEGAAASRLVRTLAWERALRELSQQELGKVVARPPGDQDQAGWTTLAEEVRGLFGEVAAEGLDFGEVAASPGPIAKTNEDCIVFFAKWTQTGVNGLNIERIGVIVRCPIFRKYSYMYKHTHTYATCIETYIM